MDETTIDARHGALGESFGVRVRRRSPHHNCLADGGRERLERDIKNARTLFPD
jgi:hypothetical protein